ncbi:MAG: hypothetical protein U0X73_10445 [Thermoanaerobaculia bacterium]
MTVRPLHLFLELATLAAFLAAAVIAARRRGTEGVWLYATVTALGALRENFVVLAQALYGFADLAFAVGRAPLLSAVIWGLSIDAAVGFAERVTPDRLAPGRLPARFQAAVAVFMLALAGFYEPFLKLVDLARWEPGTRRVLGVPQIALVGYPTLALLFLALFAFVMARWPRPGQRFVAFALAIPALAFAHAAALTALKRALAW